MLAVGSHLLSFSSPIVDERVSKADSRKSWESPDECIVKRKRCFRLSLCRRSRDSAHEPSKAVACIPGSTFADHAETELALVVIGRAFDCSVGTAPASVAPESCPEGVALHPVQHSRRLSSVELQ